MLQRLLKPFAEVRREETGAVLLMFLYSFLAMTAYNIVQPITRSKFISAHGADNLPYVLLVSVFLVGLLMQGYGKLGSLLPGRWLIPATQGLMVVLLVAFWALFGTPRGWVASAFYWFGQIYGILLISQFWTLANLIFDPRQAKRVFGFIGAGSSLGGLVGGSITAFLVQLIGNRQLVLASAGVLALCAVVVAIIVSRARGVELSGLERAGEEQGVGGKEALRMLRESKHLQIIGVVIALTSIGAGLVDQQLNMATEAFKGRNETDAMTAVLGQVQVYTSAIGFVIQIWLTSRIQRFLGVGFALMLLPLGLGATAVIILVNAALWAPILARVLDKSVRYTVDKTSREILFLPLPSDLKHKAKPFVDVTVDRFGRALSAILLLVLIAPWGLQLDWQQISYASLGIMAFWIGMAVVAKRGYLKAFRNSLERRDMKPADMRLAVADLSTVEALVEELAHPDEQRVLDAIAFLESLDKRHLVTPLLLHHPSAAVRARALSAMGSVRPEIAGRWAPAVERLLGDEHPDVRAAAVAALAGLRGVDAAAMVRPLLASNDPRVVVTAAVALAGTGREADIAEAERAFTRLSADSREAASAARKDLAIAVRRIGDPRFRHLLMLLMNDPDLAVGEEALRSVKALGEIDFLFVPTLITLLRNRQLKAAARDVLVSYGEPVVDALAHFVRDPDENIWVRRHLPATIARIPCQKSMDALVAALAEQDGFLRYKVVAAIEKLRRGHPELAFPREPIEKLALREGWQYSNYLSLHYNLSVRARLPKGALLLLALEEETARALDRVYRLLGLIYPWKDIAAARWAIEHGDARSRAGALEYLDNILTGALRKKLMPVIEEAPLEEKVRKANLALRTRPRDEEETLLQLINDDDAVVSALAIDTVRQRQVWALEADIEHVLAHRDPRDWHVFEIASWALAERRMPTERVRQLWLEPLPAAIIADRLRRLPMFASVGVDELFRMAGVGRQVRQEAGQVLCQEGAIPEGVKVLLDGRAIAKAGDGAPRPVEAPALLGFEEALAGRPCPDLVRATEVAVGLFIKDDDFRTLLADNTDLVEGLFRTLVDRWPDPSRLVMREACADGIPAPGAAGLSAVDRVLVLHRLPVFSRISAEEILHLGAIARDTALEAGRTVAGEADPPAITILLSGDLSLEPAEPSKGDAISASSGDVIGLYETLAGVPLGRRQRVARGGWALRIEREDLFDLLGQRPALLQQLFAALFRNHQRKEERGTGNEAS